MILANKIAAGGQYDNFVAETFLKILSPFAPHLCEELWQQLGRKKPICLEAWPAHDPTLIAEKFIELIIQINGKIRDKLRVEADITEQQAENLARQSEKIKAILEGNTVKNVIFVPGKLINFVV
jgi:leucyl-tRNA synthetase